MASLSLYIVPEEWVAVFAKFVRIRMGFHTEEAVNTLALGNGKGSPGSYSGSTHVRTELQCNR